MFMFKSKPKIFNKLTNGRLPVWLTLIWMVIAHQWRKPPEKLKSSLSEFTKHPFLENADVQSALFFFGFHGPWSERRGWFVVGTLSNGEPYCFELGSHPGEPMVTFNDVIVERHRYNETCLSIWQNDPAASIQGGGAIRVNRLKSGQLSVKIDRSLEHARLSSIDALLSSISSCLLPSFNRWKTQKEMVETRMTSTKPVRYNNVI